MIRTIQNHLLVLLLESVPTFMLHVVMVTDRKHRLKLVSMGTVVTAGARNWF